MKVTHVRRKVMLSALAGAIMIPGSVIRVKAADSKNESEPLLPVAGIESVLTECLETNVKDKIDLYLIPTSGGGYLNRAFSNVKDFSYIRSAPDEKSDWTGKIYADSTVEVLEYKDGWTKIRSGNVEGYVPADTLYTGEEAKKHAKEYETEVVTVLADVLNVRSGQGTENDILTQVMFKQQFEVTGEPESGWYPVKVDEFDGWVCGDYVEAETTFSYAESKEEEKHRLAQEKQDNGAASVDGRTVHSDHTNGTQANRAVEAQPASTNGATVSKTARTRSGSADRSRADEAAETRSGITGGSLENETAGIQSGSAAETPAREVSGGSSDSLADTPADGTDGAQNGNDTQQKADSTAEVQEAAEVENQEYTGQAVVDFACQFIGNPYVWGGTSLTNGADCSGFVQSVYANFGIALPRTTWDMVNVGYEVSYDQALPGDLVLYDGHVGLYMGDGNIVNAMNEAQGIGICTATYAPIITIRRVL